MDTNYRSRIEQHGLPRHPCNFANTQNYFFARSKFVGFVHFIYAPNHLLVGTLPLLRTGEFTELPKVELLIGQVPVAQD